jgi:hypothetical protein
MKLNIIPTYFTVTYIYYKLIADFPDFLCSIVCVYFLQCDLEDGEEGKRIFGSELKQNLGINMLTLCLSVNS